MMASGYDNYQFVLCSVQFHPEGMAGPKDLELLFDVFLEQVRQHKSQGVSDGWVFDGLPPPTDAWHHPPPTDSHFYAA